MDIKWLACILVWASLSSIAASQAVFRLPNTITPTRYSLSLTPTLASPFPYSGTVAIYITVSSTATGEQLTTISLHKDSSVVVDRTAIVLSDPVDTAKTITVTSTNYDASSQIYNLILQTSLTPGASYLLTIPFTGTLRQDKLGLHVGSYTYKSVTSYYMASNFWPTYARLAFPCFDEPQFKATFDVRITRSTNQFSASNHVLSGSATKSTLMEDMFTTTPMMSVHSLSLFVADTATMYSEKASSSKGTTLNLWKPTGMENSFANKSLGTFQTYIEQILLVNHPLGHITVIVMPDLKLEAYGGFGMIFLREDILLPYQGYMVQQVMDSYLVILDQMIRQYVSHYVTPAWWSDVWLTEGIATYLKYLVMTYVTSGLNTDQLIAVNIRQKALAIDIADYNAKPLMETVDSTMAILRSVSDDIKKYKGAALILMIDTAFSGAASTAFITKYLVDKKFSTSTTAEFFQMITTISTEFTGMDSWYNTIGYPYTSVIRDGQNVMLGQTTSLGLKYSSMPSTWKVPITYTYTSRPETDWLKTLPQSWLSAAGLNISFPANMSEWIIFNIKAGGYYRVVYNSTNLELIQSQLKSNSYRVNDINHAAIVDDVTAAAASGHLSYDLALKFLRETSTHARYSVWISTIKALKFLRTNLYGKSGYAAFKTYVKSLLTYPYNQVGALSDPSEKMNVTMFRSLILPWACEFEVGDCISRANTAMNMVGNTTTKEERANTEYYDVDAMMCAAFKNVDEKTFQKFFTYYKANHNRDAMQYYIASGLGCVTNKNNLNIVLMSLFDGTIYEEDIETVFTKTYSMMENVDTVLPFIVNNASVILQKHGQPLLMKLIQGVGSQLNTADQLMHLSTIFNSTTDSTVQNTVSSVVSTVNPRVVWITDNNGPVTTVLESVTKSSATIFTHSVILILFTITIINVNNMCIFI